MGGQYYMVLNAKAISEMKLELFLTRHYDLVLQLGPSYGFSFFKWQ